MNTRDQINDSVIDNSDETGYHSDGLGERVSAGLDRLLTVQEICDLLQVPKTYIYWLTHTKRIPFIKMQGHLRFRQSEIDEWLRSQEVCNNASLQKEFQDRE